MILHCLHIYWSWDCYFLLSRPYAPSDNQATTETAENRAPPSDHHDSVNNTTPGAEARKSILSSSPGSTSESQETAGSDPDKVSFIPGHARSFSEPPCSISSSHNRSISQLSRISGYSTGHSFSSSLEGKSSRRYSILEWCWHYTEPCTHLFLFS